MLTNKWGNTYHEIASLNCGLSSHAYQCKLQTRQCLICSFIIIWILRFTSTRRKRKDEHILEKYRWWILGDSSEGKSLAKWVSIQLPVHPPSFGELSPMMEIYPVNFECLLLSNSYSDTQKFLKLLGYALEMPHNNFTFCVLSSYEHYFLQIPSQVWISIMWVNRYHPKVSTNLLKRNALARSLCHLLFSQLLQSSNVRHQSYATCHNFINLMRSELSFPIWQLRRMFVSISWY